MDDLFSGLLTMVVAAFVIAAVVALALAVLAASALGAGAGVGARGIAAFLGALYGQVSTRGAATRQPLPPEPANELYVLGQFRRDLQASGRDSWTAMESTRLLIAGWADGLMDGYTMPLGIGLLVGGYVGMAIGAVVCAIVALPVLLVAGVVIASSWVLIWVLRLAETVRRRVRRTSYECPVDQDRFPLPVYVCPGCGAEHRQLVPGRWGILKRECQCGQVALPTMVLNGRQRVPQRCPAGHSMDGMIGYAELIRVAIVAGPRAGKSTYLAGALHELDLVSSDGKLSLGVLDDSRSDFETALANLQRGQTPQKTNVAGNPALVAEIQGGGRSRVLSLYDVAGESFVGDDAIRDLRFLEVPSGLVLLIDPLSLDAVASDHEADMTRLASALAPSTLNPIRVLETALGALGAAGARLDKLPVAVVVAKADAFGIGDEIEALEATAGEGAVPTWLDQQGAGNFVRTVEQSFKNVGWFHASALGRIPDPTDRTAFAPSGTAEPLLWLLRQNGVVPASSAFSPSQSAERLRGASAGDFPPISRAGWALRAIPAAFVAVLALTALSFGVVAATSAASGGSDGGTTSAAATDPAGSSDSQADRNTPPTDDSDPPPIVGDDPTADTQHFEHSAFALDLPSDWEVGDEDDTLHPGKGAFTESDWYPSAAPSVSFKVEYSEGITADPIVGAQKAEAGMVGNSSYQRLGWESTTLGGIDAFRWEWTKSGVHKVIWYLDGCDDMGYAMVGASGPVNWPTYEPIFEAAAQSFTPTC